MARKSNKNGTTPYRLRKKPKDMMPLIFKYVQEGKSVSDIASDHKCAESWVREFIHKFYTKFRDIVETEALLQSHAIDMKGGPTSIPEKITLYKSQSKIDKDINKYFIDKISDPNDSVLTEEEIIFCRLLIYEGDDEKALIDSGLAEGLSPTRTQAVRPMKLRIILLKQKKNIQRFLNELQINYAKELNVSKEMVQTELIRQLSELKAQNNPRNAPTIAKLTEQLGRTVGAFTDKVVVEEISFDAAMDKMLEMRDAKAPVGLPGGSIAGEPDKVQAEPTTFVYDPEAIG